jgi:hypothetical protein
MVAKADADATLCGENARRTRRVAFSAHHLSGSVQLVQRLHALYAPGTAVQLRLHLRVAVADAEGERGESTSVTPHTQSGRRGGTALLPQDLRDGHDTSLAGIWLGHRDLAFRSVPGKCRMNRLRDLDKEVAHDADR